jgi:hypothetical protein
MRQPMRDERRWKPSPAFGTYDKSFKALRRLVVKGKLSV